MRRREKIMWERFPPRPRHYLPLFSSRRSICRADSEPDRTTLQLLSIISRRGCSYNLAIVSRATLLSLYPSFFSLQPASFSSLFFFPPSLSLSLSLYLFLLSYAFSLETPVNGKQSKQRQSERERKGETGKISSNQMKRTRNGYNGVVSCADTARETGLFASGWKSSTPGPGHFGTTSRSFPFLRLETLQTRLDSTQLDSTWTSLVESISDGRRCNDCVLGDWWFIHMYVHTWESCNGETFRRA